MLVYCSLCLPSFSQWCIAKQISCILQSFGKWGLNHKRDERTWVGFALLFNVSGTWLYKNLSPLYLRECLYFHRCLAITTFNMNMWLQRKANAFCLQLLLLYICGDIFLNFLQISSAQQESLEDHMQVTSAALESFSEMNSSLTSSSLELQVNCW